MAAVVRRNVARLRTAALDLQAAMETRSVARAKRLVYGAKKERKTIEDTLEYIEMDLVVATGDTVEQPLCIREAARWAHAHRADRNALVCLPWGSGWSVSALTILRKTGHQRKLDVSTVQLSDHP